MTSPTGFVVGVEKLERVHAEIGHLFYAHWDETLEPLLGSLFPPWQKLIEAEQAGKCVLFTARYAEHLFGYFLGSFGSPVTQSQLRVLTEIGFYIAPEARRGGLGIRMMQYVEETARLIGCNRVEMFAVPMADGRDAGAIYRRRGYKPTAVQYMKDL